MSESTTLSKDGTSAKFGILKAEMLRRDEKEAGVEERRAACLCTVLNAVVDQHHKSSPERQEERDWDLTIALVSLIRTRAQKNIQVEKCHFENQPLSKEACL